MATHLKSLKCPVYSYGGWNSRMCWSSYNHGISRATPHIFLEVLEQNPLSLHLPLLKATRIPWTCSMFHVQSPYWLFKSFSHDVTLTLAICPEFDSSPFKVTYGCTGPCLIVEDNHFILSLGGCNHRFLESGCRHFCHVTVLLPTAH